MTKKLIAIASAVVLAPLLAFANAETAGTVVKVNKVENQLVIKTGRGEETLFLDSKTKGLANAKEGANVIIKFTEKSGDPKVTEIILQERAKDHENRR